MIFTLVYYTQLYSYIELDCSLHVASQLYYCVVANYGEHLVATGGVHFVYVLKLSLGSVTDDIASQLTIMVSALMCMVISDYS